MVMHSCRVAVPASCTAALERVKKLTLLGRCTP